MKLYVILELAPSEEQGFDEARVVEVFEREEDATVVLSALESVNVLHNTYIIHRCKQSELPKSTWHKVKIHLN